MVIPLCGVRSKESVLWQLTPELELSEGLPQWQGEWWLVRIPMERTKLQKAAVEWWRADSLCAWCCHCRDTRGALGLFAKQDTGKEDLVGVSTSSYLGSRRPLLLPPDKHCIGCKPKDSMIKGRCTRMVLNLASDEMLINSICRIERFLLSRENFSTDLDLRFVFQLLVPNHHLPLVSLP